MSKETKNLAEQADKGIEKEEVVAVNFRLNSGYNFRHSVKDVATAVKQSVDYPLSKTDQLHAQSVAQMVSQGQGQIADDNIDHFTFADGVDDGTLESRPFSETIWADPAELYESEQAVKAELTKGKKAAQAAAEAAKAANNLGKSDEHNNQTTTQKDNYTSSDDKEAPANASEKSGK